MSLARLSIANPNKISLKSVLFGEETMTLLLNPWIKHSYIHFPFRLSFLLDKIYLDKIYIYKNSFQKLINVNDT